MRFSDFKFFLLATKLFALSGSSIASPIHAVSLNPNPSLFSRKMLADGLCTTNQDKSMCTLTSLNKPGTYNVKLWAFRADCSLLGHTDRVFPNVHYNFYTQLPWVIVVDLYQQNSHASTYPEFWYAGRKWTALWKSCSKTEGHDTLCLIDFKC